MESDIRARRIILAIALGALGGVFAVAVSRVIIPKMMAGMMKNMMARMKEEGCNPSEI